MTISYNLDVASASSLNFFRLIFRWKGSIWKLCLKELCIWTVLFLIVTFIYRTPYFLSYEQKVTFEKLAYYFDSHLSYIPLTFMLGFFVQIVVRRWSVLFENMGYVESTSIYIGGYVYGEDDESRLWRRTMARYLCLTQLLVYRDISVRVRKRFPTYDSIIEAGFMLENEREMLDSIKINFDKYWVPINWIYALIFRARKDGKIVSDSFTNKLCDEIKNFRYNIQMLCNYDWVPIPLAYPQLVFLAVYVYFAICLVSRQFIITDREASYKSNIDLIVPVVTMMEFIIFVGWMKVAEGLLNPFGEDDDDFESNFLLDKNLATSLCIVDDASNDAPELEKDQFWSSSEVDAIYSKESAENVNNPLVGSATLARIPMDSDGMMYVRKSIDSAADEANGISRNRFSRKFRRFSSIFPTSSSSVSKRHSVFVISPVDRNLHQADGAEVNDNVSLRHKPIRRHMSAFDISSQVSTVSIPMSGNETANSLPSSPHPRRVDVTSRSERSGSHTGSRSELPIHYLSPVEEEDPNNLTINRPESTQRIALDSIDFSTESNKDSGKEIQDSRKESSQDTEKTAASSLSEVESVENRALFEKEDKKKE